MKEVHLRAFAWGSGDSVWAWSRGIVGESKPPSGRICKLQEALGHECRKSCKAPAPVCCQGTPS